LVSSAIVLCRVLWHAGASVLCLVLIQELAPLFLSRCACSGSFQLGCIYRSQEASNVLHRWSCINGLASNVLTIHAGGQSGHLCVSGAGQDKGIRKSTGGAARPEQAPSQSDHHQVFNGKLEECNKTVTLYRPAFWHLSHAVSEGKGLVSSTRTVTCVLKPHPLRPFSNTHTHE